MHWVLRKVTFHVVVVQVYNFANLHMSMLTVTYWYRIAFCVTFTFRLDPQCVYAVHPSRRFGSVLNMKRAAPCYSNDDFTDMEDAALALANNINPMMCESLGVGAAFIEEWMEGVVLKGDSSVEHYFMEDYPNIKEHVQVAAEEMDRLTSLGKILWYPMNSHPDDLCVCPANIVLGGKRPRIVHDWTRAGLNQHLVIPEVNYGTMDSLVESISPNCYLAGLDFQDYFMHWAIARESRRRLGVRHPSSGRVGVFLFLPFGLGPAPGINDRNIAEVVRVVSHAVGDLKVSAFVDDLRLVNSPESYRDPQEDKDTLCFKLCQFKELCEAMGLKVHEKEGKLIWPTTAIDWIGWIVDTVAMEVRMADSKVVKGLRLCKEMFDLINSGNQYMRNMP